jgi:hypothetical protein
MRGSLCEYSPAGWFALTGSPLDDPQRPPLSHFQCAPSARYHFNYLPHVAVGVGHLFGEAGPLPPLGHHARSEQIALDRPLTAFWAWGRLVNGHFFGLENTLTAVIDPLQGDLTHQHLPPALRDARLPTVSPIYSESKSPNNILAVLPICHPFSVGMWCDGSLLMRRLRSSRTLQRGKATAKAPVAPSSSAGPVYPSVQVNRCGRRGLP